MSEMTPHQERLWREMIAAVDRYRAGSVALDDLVGDLHGAMQAGDFGDDDLVKNWHDRWGPLEEWRATDEARRVSERIDEQVEAMRLFLLGVLRVQAAKE